MKERIERILRYYSVSPSQFADELGVQRSNISHILSERNKPSLDFVLKVIQRFKDINPEWLLVGKGEMLRSSNGTQSLFEIHSETDSEKQVAISPNKANISDHPETRDEIKNITSITREAIENNTDNESINLNEGKISVKSTDKSKVVEKIVIFYTDKTFDAYVPG